MDVHDVSTRSRNMAAIRSCDTKPELIIRKELFKRGYRYRLNDKQLPGKPDIVLKKYNAVIFVHGCFWHRHDCELFKWPETRKEFWRKKINSNKNRDSEVMDKLQKSDWRVLQIWECAIKGRNRKSVKEVTKEVSDWLNSDITLREIQGKEIS